MKINSVGGMVRGWVDRNITGEIDGMEMQEKTKNRYILEKVEMTW